MTVMTAAPVPTFNPKLGYRQRLGPGPETKVHVIFHFFIDISKHF